MYIPSSTYRVQLHAGFTLRHLAGLIPYLHELGISTVYFSPITTAFKGSQHGYDVTDPLALNPEIGTLDDLAGIVQLLKGYGMGWMQDIVPNHMAYGAGNRWLYDLLERGRDSEYYGYFDIDTDHSTVLTSDKLMAPFLGQTLTECIQQGEIRLGWGEEGFCIRYFDQWFPVAAGLYTWIVTLAAGCPPALALSLQHLEQGLSHPADDWAQEKLLWLQQVSEHPDWEIFLADRIAFINQRISLVEELLQNQHYLLTHYHLASSRINYRRFFAVNSLISLRMEHPVVFRRWHAWLLELLQKGWIDALRIDHIDGLAAPAEYCHRLRAAFGENVYILAEKILGPDESMPGDWGLQGTTGYEMASWLNRLMTDPGGMHSLEAYYRNNFSEDMPDYADLVFDRKHRFLQLNMGGDWENLTSLWERTVGIDAKKREGYKQALGYLMAAWPNYRIYPGDGPLTEEERAVLEQAFARAENKAPALHRELAFIRMHVEAPAFFRRLMQFTGPLAAKGIEDTVFYIYNPLISHNEVGDNPGLMTMTVHEFHDKMQERQAHMPYSLNAGTTHDTKRGEDSRIRLNYLSVIAAEWQDAVSRWRRLNAGLVLEDVAGGQRSPSLNDEYYIYQSLLGAFPTTLILTDEFRGRFHGFLTKALREASVYTGYDHPNEAYEKQCHLFVSRILEENSAFLEDFIPFVHRVLKGSAKYALAQQALRLTVPGVPDIYQGSELWELSLVDPDNRRPVDYALRQRLLAEMKVVSAGGWEDCAAWLEREDRHGGGKLFVTWKVLQLRKEMPRLFSEGRYVPLETGDGSMLAFLRQYEDRVVLVAVPLMRESGSPADGISIRLPTGSPVHWRDTFTGIGYDGQEGRLDIDDGFARFPVLLLVAG